MTPDQRLLLSEAFHSAQKEIEVVITNGDSGERYGLAQGLEDSGMLQWLGATGRVSPGMKRLRLRYVLTPAGEQVARGILW